MESREWLTTTRLKELEEAASKTMSLWIRHGLGDDEDESGPVYLELEQAILNARRALGK